MVLANDDFDDEITHLKEVVPSEFTEIVNVSNIAAINVTQDNVDQLYNNMLTPDTQFSTFQGHRRNMRRRALRFKGHKINIRRSSLPFNNSSRHQIPLISIAFYQMFIVFPGTYLSHKI